MSITSKFNKMKIEIIVNDIEKYENFSLRVVDEELDKSFDNITHTQMTYFIKVFLMPRKEWNTLIEEVNNKKT